MRLSELVSRREEFLQRVKSGFPYKLTGATIEDLLHFGRTPAGAWNRDQLAALGIPWPLKAGWKRRLVHRGELPSEFVQRFLLLATVSRAERKKMR